MRLVAYALCVWLLSGCTFIGMGIGADTTRFVATQNPSEGDTIRVTTRGGEHIVGRLDAKENGALALSTGDAVPFEDIRVIERRSNYFARGAAIGALIDVVCWGAIIAGMVVGASNRSSFSFGGGGF